MPFFCKEKRGLRGAQCELSETGNQHLVCVLLCSVRLLHLMNICSLVSPMSLTTRTHDDQNAKILIWWWLPAVMSREEGGELSEEKEGGERREELEMVLLSPISCLCPISLVMFW